MTIGAAISARKSDGVAARVVALTKYIMHLDGELAKDHHGDKVLYSGSRGFVFTDERAQISEMIALASSAKRSTDPIFHSIYSLESGEVPTYEQAVEMVDIALRHFGMESHQCFWSVHHDTKNIHLHLELNRVDPATEKCKAINNRFYKEAVQQVAALIDHAQGWKHTEGTRYRCDVDGNLVKLGDKKPGQSLDKKRTDMEVRTGEKSAQRVGHEAAWPVIRAARSWTELHTGLAALGMRYERQGSGAVLRVGETNVKASDINRDAAFGKLVRRLGAYIQAGDLPVAEGDQVQQLHHQPMLGAPGNWGEYAQSRRERFAAKDAQTAVLKASIDSRYSELFARQKAERQATFAGQKWHGRGADLNAARSLLAARHAAEKADLKDQAVAERAALRAKFPAFPSFEDWLRGQSEQAAEAWRYRLDETPEAFIGQVWKQPVVGDIRDFFARPHGPNVAYFSPDGRRSFVDTGRKIFVHIQDDASILAAMQLARQKFGFVQIGGSAEFQKRCLEVAAEHGIRLKNPELQADWERLNALRKAEKHGRNGQADRVSKPEFKPGFDLSGLAGLKPGFAVPRQPGAGPGRPRRAAGPAADAEPTSRVGDGAAFTGSGGAGGADQRPGGVPVADGAGADRAAALEKSGSHEAGSVDQTAQNPVLGVQGRGVDENRGNEPQVLVPRDEPRDLVDRKPVDDRGLRRPQHDPVAPSPALFSIYKDGGRMPAEQLEQLESHLIKIPAVDLEVFRMHASGLVLAARGRLNKADSALKTAWQQVAVAKKAYDTSRPAARRLAEAGHKNLTTPQWERLAKLELEKRDQLMDMQAGLKNRLAHVGAAVWNKGPLQAALDDLAPKLARVNARLADLRAVLQVPSNEVAIPLLAAHREAEAARLTAAESLDHVQADLMGLLERVDDARLQAAEADLARTGHRYRKPAARPVEDGPAPDHEIERPRGG